MSGTVKCRKLIHGKDIGWVLYGCAISWCDFDMNFDLAIVTLSFKILFGPYLRNCNVQEVDSWMFDLQVS